MPGMGGDTPLNPAIDLDTYVEATVHLFVSQDIHDAVLVAHSFSGMTACGAMEQIHERVRSLVFFDAQVPNDGESSFDVVHPSVAAKMRETALRGGEGWYIPPPEDASVWGLEDAYDIAWATSLASAQPLATYEQKLPSSAYARSHPYTFVECTPTSLPAPMAQWQRLRCAASEYLRHRTIDAPHEAMVVAPQAVADVLFEALDPPASMDKMTGAPERPDRLAASAD